MNISGLLTINCVEILPETIHFTKKTRLWCRLPYPDHPNGCPNYNNNPVCPPNAPFLSNITDNYNYFYLITGRFNLLSYKESMLQRHPKWSERQATCVLYWQGSAKRHIKDFVKEIYSEHPENSFFLLSSGSGYKRLDIQQEKIYSMEAAGIDVFKTLRKNSIKFELKPKRFVLLVNLLCSDKELNT